MTRPRYEMRPIGLDAYAKIAREREVLVCQAPQWLQFLQISQGAQPVLAEVFREDESIGCFSGAIVRKAGLRILGSPLRGWTTSYMGFAVDAGAQAADLLPALRSLAFSKLGCAHVELLDREISAAGYEGWQSRTLHGYEIDLTQSEEELFAGMAPACRRCIRKAERVGLSVEEVQDTRGFAEEFHVQLREVFSRQSLRPPYGPQRVQQLIEALHPPGMLLLLRARDARGRVVATSIFPGYGCMMYFWGGASIREGLLDRPNEAMMWHAMRWWKARGVKSFDMGGGGAYKAKYGGMPIAVPWLRSSRSGLVSLLRTGAEAALRLKQRFAPLRRGER